MDVRGAEAGMSAPLARLFPHTTPTVPPRTRLELHEAVPVLYDAVCNWLRKRGKVVRPRLEERQRAELKECFALMVGAARWAWPERDLDSSGAIDVEELSEALKLLGIKMTHRQTGYYPPSKDQLLAAAKASIQSGKGKVTLAPWKRLVVSNDMMEAAIQRSAEEQPALYFRAVDQFYNRQELEEQVQALMDEADKDGTGELEYGEFLQVVTPHSPPHHITPSS
ncbi:hypothetical protein QJQ45_017863 [Haematococcus lacustris]|nr:hypothetical protein QJQ45_017863 [Haematococcus lacustris]